MSTTASRTRRPAGTPVGGQFAPDVHAEPEVEIRGFGSPEAFVEAARRSVAYWTTRWRARPTADEIDDATQDLAVAFMRFARNRDLENPHGYLHAMARNTVVGRGQQAARDFTHRHTAPAPFESDQGADIEDAFPPVPSAEDQVFAGEGAAVDPDSGLGRLNTALRRRGDVATPSESQVAMGAIRGSLWSVLSERAGVHVRLAPTSKATASRSRGAVEQAGGAAAVAQGWEGGEPRPGAEVALFRPFAASTDADRRAVVSVLMRHADYADDIWSAALFGSCHVESRVSGVA